MNNDWFYNISIWCGLAGWMVAQLAKLLIHLFKTWRFDPAFLFRLGGMPSSHSSSVCSAATSIGLLCGFGSPIFALAFGLAMVVMIDAQSVRRAAGQQARLLNQIVEELFKEHRFSQEKLVEFLGHTRLEVLLGAVMGVFTALLVHGLFPAR